MLLQESLVKYFQSFHINIMHLLSIYFYVQNLLEILLLSLSLSSLRYFFFLEIFVFWCLVLCLSCYRIIVLTVFIISDANIKSLVYWLFFIEYLIASTFSKLAYFYWSKLAINRYTIHLLKSPDLILFLSSASVTFLKSSRFYT